MAYNANIPNPSDRLKDSQPQLKGNFQDLTSFQGSVANMLKQSVDPATNSMQMAMYVRQSPSTSANEIAIRRSSSGAIVDMTAGDLSTIGWCYLPAGILLKWGFATATAMQSINASQGPAFTAVFSIQLTPLGGNPPNTAITLLSVGNPFTVSATFRTQTVNTVVGFHYLMIGT